MRCTAFQFTALPFTAIGLLTALAIAGLVGGSVRAQQPDATTISVAVAQGNAHCLIKTGTMKADKAQSIADGFLAQQQISPQASDAGRNTAGFSDLNERLHRRPGRMLGAGGGSAAVTTA